MRLASWRRWRAAPSQETGSSEGLASALVSVVMVTVCK